MKFLGKINNREIKYLEFSLTEPWYDSLPSKDWLLFVIAEEKNLNYFQEVISKSLENDVAYLSCTGKSGEYFHDIFNEEIAFREADIEPHYLPDHFIITVWNQDLKEALWFATKLAVNDKVQIDIIICIDLSENKANNQKELKRTIQELSSSFS